MDQVYLDIYNLIWKEIFPDSSPPDIEVFKKLYTKDLDLPQKFQCAITGKDVYVGRRYGYKRVIHEDAMHERANVDDWMVKKEPLNNIHDLLNHMHDLSLFRCSRAINCDTFAESDNIYSSSFVFNCTDVHNCQKVLFCEGCSQNEYLMASKGSGGCSFGIRIMDSGKTTNSFDIDWSGNMANCYFCHDSYDLRDCFMCFNLKSKQYCIGNMQFEEAEYKELKTKLTKDYLAQLILPNAFVTLKDL